MKYLHRTAGIVTAFCLMIILFITSVEAVVYWTPGYFEKEYAKYNVLDSLPSMTMDSLLHVTDEMMDYLRGDRDDLHVTTTMGGEQREFFNEREIAHMEDVQVLFLKALSIRRACLVLGAGLLILMAATRARMGRVLPPSLCMGTGLFFGLITVLGSSYPLISPNTSFCSTTSSSPTTCGFWTLPRTCSSTLFRKASLWIRLPALPCCLVPCPWSSLESACSSP